MRILPWDHNAYYHPLLLSQLPSPCHDVLEVGCGTGSLAIRLAERADHVDALDRASDMIAIARRRVPTNVTCIEADVLEVPLPPNHYDAIISLSTFHHLPLAPTLRKLAAALRPGGVLAAIALPKVQLTRDLPVELAARAAHGTVGIGLLVKRLAGRPVDRLTFDPEDAGMPVREPALNVREVAEQAKSVLPGVEVKRLLYWRYFLLWHKPALGPAG